MDQNITSSGASDNFGFGARQMRQYKYLGTITVLYVAMQLISDVTAGKIVQIGPFPVSVTVLYFPITFVFADVLTEVYGYAAGRRVLWNVIFCSFIAGVIYQIVAILPPAQGFAVNDAYRTVLGQVPRVLVGSWIAVFVGEILNDFVLAKLKVICQGKHLWLRLIGSTVVGQFVNTALFYTIGLWGVLPQQILVESILSAWLLKVVVEILLVPVTYWVVAWLKKEEHEDHFDTDTNFNPFSFNH